MDTAKALKKAFKGGMISTIIIFIILLLCNLLDSSKISTSEIFEVSGVVFVLFFLIPFIIYKNE